MKKKSFIVSLGLILSFVCTLAYAGDSSSNSAAGSASQPNLLLKGSNISMGGGRLDTDGGRLDMGGGRLNMQGGRVVNVERILFESTSAAGNPRSSRDLVGRRYVDMVTKSLQDQITELRKSLGSGSGCQPGYVLVSGACIPEANLRP